MTTGQAIELMFDPESGFPISQIWRRIGAGIYLGGFSVRPHVSLAAVISSADR